MTRERRGIRDLGVRLWWRQITADALAVIAMSVIVAMAALSVTLAPRVFDRATTDDLSEAIAEATPEQRNLSLEWRTSIGAGAPRVPFSNVELIGEMLRDDNLPDGLVRLLTGEQWMVDTPQFVVSSFPEQVEGPFPTTFKFRAQQDLDLHSELVEGTFPTARDPWFELAGTECPPEDEVDDIESFQPGFGQDCAVVVIPVFETAISQQTADDMMLDVGDVVTLTPSFTDPAFRTATVDAGSLRFALEISGIMEFADEDLEYWYADTALHRPSITENPDFRLIFATGVLSADQYRPFRAAAPGVESSFAWRYLVDADAVEATDPAALAADLEKIGPPDVTVVTQLPDLLNDHLRQRQLTVQLVSLAAVGLAVAALAAVWVLANVDTARRRPVTDLFAGRGASHAQLAMNSARTGLVVAVPASVVAGVTAHLLVSSDGVTITPAVPVALVAVWAVMATDRSRRHEASDDRRRMRRAVRDTGVALGGVAAVWLLRRRESGVADAADGTFDWLLAMTPVLVAVGVGLISARLIGPLGRLAGAISTRGRGAGWFVGFRRMINQPLELRSPVIAITVAAAVAVFATVVGDAVRHSQELASWNSVGGDYRVETAVDGVPLPTAVQADITSTADDVAFGTTLRLQRFETADGGSYVSDLIAIDAEAFAAVVAIDELAAAAPRADASSGDAVPAVAVGPDTPNSPSVDDELTLETGAYAVPVSVEHRVERFAGVPAGRPALVVDRATLGALTDERTVDPTFAVFTADDVGREAVSAALTERLVLASFVSRSERLDRLAGDPLSLAASRALSVVGLAGVAFAMVTSSAAAVLAAQNRRGLGVLAVLGMEARSLRRIVAVELVPGVVVSALAGATFGALVARWLSDSLSLGAFAGDGSAPGVALSWQPIVLVIAPLIAGSIVTTSIAVRSLQRIDHAMLLRRGNS